MEILFVTGNKEKIAIAKSYLDKTDVKLKSQKIDCVEIQDDENEEIAKYSARYASDKLKANVVKVDTGFYIEALDGFPGPYAEYVERKLDASDILKMMEGKDKRDAYYKEVLALAMVDGSVVTFTTYTRGKIADKLDGEMGYNFDRIFIASGDTKTMANYTDEERACKYSRENWVKLVEYLNKR